MVSKATLARAWVGLQALSGLGLAVLAWGLLPDVDTGWRVLAVLVVVAAWGAVGVLGLVLVLSGRAAADGARSARDAARDVEAVRREVDHLRADVRADRDRTEARATTLAADLDDLSTALTAGLADARKRSDHLDEHLHEHLDRVGTAVEQVGLDTSRGLSATAGRLDEVEERLRDRSDHPDPPA